MKPRKNKIHSHKLEDFFPAGSLFLVVVLSNAWPSSHFEVIPDFMLPVIYYWSVFRPNSSLAITFFLIGLLEDVLIGNFIGVTSCIWLILYLFTLTQRRFLLDKSFLLVWVGYMLVGAVIFTLKWWLLSYLANNVIAPQPVIFSYLLSIGFYPVIARIISFFTKVRHA